jgi:hypothetical protein
MFAKKAEFSVRSFLETWKNTLSFVLRSRWSLFVINRGYLVWSANEDASTAS